MNTRLKMALLLHSGESGFALVVAISLGLIMILVGLTMTMRSQGDEITASTQKASERALAAAEQGVTFYQTFLNGSGVSRRLAQYPDCATERNADGECTDDEDDEKSWHNPTSIRGISSACNAPSIDDLQDVYASTGWKDVVTGDPSKGQFRLVSYNYIPPSDPTLTLGRGIGRLTIEGRIAVNDQDVKSITKVQVDFPIVPGNIYGIPIPGVWIGGTSDSDGTSNNGVKGNVMINNCSITDDDLNTIQRKLNEYPGNYKVRKTDLAMPTAAEIEDLYRPTARVIGSPANAPSASSPHQPGVIPLDNVISAAGNNGTITLPITTDNFSNPSQPRPRDENFKYTDDVYYYAIDNNVNNRNILLTPGQKITFFLTGSITQNVTIRCNSTNPDDCDPKDFRIYGVGSTGEICINGNNGLDGYIFAPNYVVGVQGGGNRRHPTTNQPIGNIRGAVWANQWGASSCGSQSSNLVVEQVGTWDDFPAALLDSQLPPSIEPVGAWKRN